jgi:hypothetical protein
MEVSIEDKRLVLTPQNDRDAEQLKAWYAAAKDGPGLRIEVECVNPHRATVFGPNGVQWK